jgi:TRAP transporter TAXI family solute receptor
MRKRNAFARVSLTLFLITAFVISLNIIDVNKAEARKKTTYLTMSAASLGGSIYTWMATAQKFINKQLRPKGLELVVRSGSPVENIRLLEDGEVALAYAKAYAYYQIHGISGYQKSKIRSLWNMNMLGYYFFVPKDSGASSIADLKGKTLAVGIKGGEGSDFMAYTGYLGFKPEEDFKMRFIGKREMMEAYKEGSVDGVACWNGVPGRTIIEAFSSRRGAKLISLTKEEADKINNSWPIPKDQSDMIVPAGTYKGQDKDVRVIYHFTTLSSTTDMSEDVAYEIVKAIDKSFAQIVKAYPPAKFGDLASLKKVASYPLHPGAIRYLKEKGLMN